MKEKIVIYSVCFLIFFGCATVGKDEYYWTPLLQAVYDNSPDEAKAEILRGADVNKKGKMGRPPLLWAIDNNNPDLVKLLATYGADVNAKSAAGDTALGYAASKNYLEIAEFLINRSADVNARNPKGITPLMYAVENNSFELAKLLIRNGANINARDSAGRTVLLRVVSKKLFFTAKLLIENGADVNARDQSGLTPLMYTAENNSFELAKLLLEKGADVNLKDMYGNTALFIAKKKNNFLMIETLSESAVWGVKKSQPGGKNIAVANFESTPPLSASDAVFITNFFRRAMVNSKIFNVLDRNNMDKILAEQGFQQTGCTTEDCAVQMGKLLNVHLIVIGSCGKLVSRYILTVDIIDVETSEIVASFKEDCNSDTEIENMAGKLVNTIKKEFH
ncbi:MAG: ankyrin repeat domain-containing protein [bacterium]